MGAYEKFMLNIAQKIKINDKDRQIYTNDFDIIRDSIFQYMSYDDDVFRTIYKGPSLFGSYLNNVRINCPNEFDVHITLSLPFAREIIVDEDEDRPAYVNIYMTNVLDELYDHNLLDVYDKFWEFTDDDGYLVRSRVQRWLEELFEDALEYYGCRINGYKLQYSKRGLAHTIFAKHNNGREISIDFVPAFIFGQEDWMEERKYPPFGFFYKRWYAIPKSAPGPKHTRRIAFMICNPKAEHYLLLNKQNLKVVFRLLKSFREKYCLRRLKSYFITTLFLWEAQKRSDEFWHQPVGDLFIHMLYELLKYFMDRDLPFFWNSELNLLDILHSDEIDEYTNQLASAYNTIKSYPNQPYMKLSTVEKHFKFN